MNPFQQLIDHANAPPPAVPQASALVSRHGTRTAALLHLLDVNGPMSSADLGLAIDRAPTVVSSLLNTHAKKGRVALVDGLWQLTRAEQDAEQNAVTVAVELLTSLGWQVFAPRGGKS